MWIFKTDQLSDVLFVLLLVSVVVPIFLFYVFSGVIHQLVVVFIGCRECVLQFL